MVSLVSVVTQQSGGHLVNASGGLLARSHLLGETGVAQVAEVTRHLAGRTGSLGHRPDAGLTHCTGGISGYDHAVCTVHVLTAT
jgi:acetyl-CoA acetyltransferase